MNSLPKLVAIDIDGTLLPDNGVISGQAYSLLNELHENGVILVLATGRSNIGLPECLRNIKCIDYLISSNGVTITKWGEKEPVFRDWISQKTANRICSELLRFDCVPDVLVNGQWHIDNRQYNNNKWIFPNHLCHYIEYSRVFEDSLIQYLREISGDVEKITVSFSSGENAIRKAIMDFAEKYEVQVWSDKTHKLDISQLGSSKGRALRYLLKTGAISCRDAIAFGNDVNDVDMLKTVEHSVAVSNAVEEVRNIAKYHTLSNNEDGVYRFLQEMYLR